MYTPLPYHFAWVKPNVVRCDLVVCRGQVLPSIFSEVHSSFLQHERNRVHNTREFLRVAETNVELIQWGETQPWFLILDPGPTETRIHSWI